MSQNRLLDILKHWMIHMARMKFCGLVEDDLADRKL
jgi:hypothetical protein